MEDKAETNNQLEFEMPVLDLPFVKIKSMRFQNFKVFDDYTFDFTSENGIKEFICFIGPNGYGKSTVLNSIQMIFNRYEGRDIEKLKINLGKSVRHVGAEFNEISVNEDFLITAILDSTYGEYEVQFCKSGFIKDHPEKIKENVFRLCYAARFDQELHNFQLAREKWDKFKELFEAVTDFVIEENQDVIKYFKGTDDPTMRQLINDYVLSFSIKKPHETITHKECSDGEKKIIKSFSTLLTLGYSPSIILVDNIEMHVEKGRHIKLIQAMKDCFPNSQIFSTTHSYYVSKVLGKQSGIFDLRMIKSSEEIKKQPWRLCIIDEINDCLVKLLLAPNNEDLVCRGKKIISSCEGNIKDLQEFQNEVKIFLKEVSDIFVKCVMQ